MRDAEIQFSWKAPHSSGQGLTHGYCYAFVSGVHHSAIGINFIHTFAKLVKYLTFPYCCGTLPGDHVLCEVYA